jgi:hypothetical protein
MPFVPVQSHPDASTVPNGTPPTRVDIAKGNNLPRTASPCPYSPPNSSLQGEHVGSSSSAAMMPSPIQPPNHRFDVKQSKMPQPQSAVDEPSKGAVPIYPWNANGGVNRAKPNLLPESVTKRGK